MASFSKELFGEKAKFGSRSGQPVFIVGMLRSGTTLVEQILVSIPESTGTASSSRCAS